MLHFPQNSGSRISLIFFTFRAKYTRVFFFILLENVFRADYTSERYYAELKIFLLKEIRFSLNELQIRMTILLRIRTLLK